MTNRRTRVNPILTRKHKPVSDSNEKKNLFSSPLVIGGIAFGAILILGLILILVFKPFNMLGADRVDAKNASVSHEDGLTISYISGNGIRVKLDTIPREAFLAGDSDRRFENALSAIPSYLEMKSPVYLLDSKGSAEVSIDVAIPNASEPISTLDLYTWNAEKSRWEFIPSVVNPSDNTITTRTLATNLAVFQTKPTVPIISAFMEAGDVFDLNASGVVNLVIPTGVLVDGSGAFSGSLTGGWQQGAGYAIAPAITSMDGVVLTQLGDQSFRREHVAAISTFVRASSYDGIVIDYRGLTDDDSDAYSTFLSDLDDALANDGKILYVLLPTPIQTSDGWSSGAYDWAKIGNAVDVVLVRGKDLPEEYGVDGLFMQMLEWATDQVSRVKLHAIVPSGCFDGSVLAPKSYMDTLAILGTAGTAGSVAEVKTGDEVQFLLNGNVTVTPDQNTGAYILTQNEGGQKIWLVTSSTLRARFDMAAEKKVGGISILDMFDPGRDPLLYTAISEFKTSAPSSLSGQVAVSWEVRDASGSVVNEQSVSLGSPYLWIPQSAGVYSAAAQIVGGTGIEKGLVSITVVSLQQDQPTPAPTIQQTASSATQQPAATQNNPAPVAGAGSDGGGFALGGQVQRGFSPPTGVMQSAGMTWVKYQLKWSPGMSPSAAAELINMAHGAGFKVLLSIPGQLYPTSIDFGAYTEFLRGVAAYQPDAIEIWNEMNLYVEWPEGQINPASYVSNMLAPGYNAIKSVSPNTMVIIGALAPTGVNNSKAMSDDQYVAGMAAAGAANYANCIGVHHNAGATSPSSRDGHPAGTHYSWYFMPTLEVYYYGMGGALPVCITEFGYVTGEGLGSLPEAFSWGSTNTLANQAAWLGEGASLARNLGWVRLMIIWNVGFTTWGSDPQAGYSIIRPDGSCPACSTLSAAVR